jgi:ribosomal protein S6--L-glutamate ligase
MLRLAVATRAETYDRLVEPLAERDVAVEHVQTRERAIDLTGEADFDPDRFDVGYVFPPRLMEGGVADATLDIPWINDRDAILRSRNKAETYARLERAGIPVPETTMLSNPVDRETVAATFERFEAPVVVKPNSATRGLGVTRVSDPDALVGVADTFQALHESPVVGDRSFLVQSFVKGATDYRLMVIDGQCVGGVRRSGAGWTHNVHRGGIAEGVDPGVDLRALAEGVAETLEIPLLGVDVLVNDDGPVVVETAARPTWDDASKYDGDVYDRLTALIRETAG